MGEGIAPFGLRVQIFPQIGILTMKFKSSLEKILLDCSAHMMQALIDEYTRIIVETDIELQALFFGSSRYLLSHQIQGEAC